MSYGPGEKKAAKLGKDTKRRELAAEVAALRADVNALRAALETRSAPAASPPTTEPVLEEQIQAALDSPSDAAVVYALGWRGASEEGGGNFTGSCRLQGSADILGPDDDRIARLGHALASPAKVRLLRTLLCVGASSAAQLGERAGLSTGSLYHHLRELVHAEVIRAGGRSRYELTPLGQHLVLLVFTIAGGSPGGRR